MFVRIVNVTRTMIYIFDILRDYNFWSIAALIFSSSDPSRRMLQKDICSLISRFGIFDIFMLWSTQLNLVFQWLSPNHVKTYDFVPLPPRNRRGNACIYLGSVVTPARSTPAVARNAAEGALICLSVTSILGGSQVDGLPPASS